MDTRLHFMRPRVGGLTLIEILVGLGVLGILLAVAAPSMADLLERRRVIAAAEEVVSILNYAKAETVSTNAFLSVRFDPDTYNPPASQMSCAVVATLAGFERCRCYYPANDVCPDTSQRALRLFQLPKQYVEFKAYASDWKGSTNALRFMRDQNTVAQENFEVDVTGLKKGYTLRVQVNTAGRVKLCAPSAARSAASPFRQMSGYGVCT